MSDKHDVDNGAKCANPNCRVRFATPHGYEVMCKECWSNWKEDGKSLFGTSYEGVKEASPLKDTRLERWV